METRIFLAVVAVAVASGCVSPIDNGISPGGSSSSGGLQVVKFDSADHTLTPGQETRVSLRLKNAHPHGVDFSDISLYNTGFLEVEEKSVEKRCSSTDLQPAREGFQPEMECSWTIKAPEENSGFESRSITFSANIEYESKVSNSKQPFKVTFKENSKIRKRQQLSHTFSNSEVKMRISTENPLPREGALLDISLSSTGSGRVASDYTVSYSPESVFPGCLEDKKKMERIEDDDTDFSCEIVPGTAGTSTRNLIISTSYKYVKSPSLGIEVVKP